MSISTSCRIIKLVLLVHKHDGLAAPMKIIWASEARAPTVTLPTQVSPQQMLHIDHTSPGLWFLVVPRQPLVFSFRDRGSVSTIEFSLERNFEGHETRLESGDRYGFRGVDQF